MIPPKVDLHSLIVFYFVASEGSITAAADKLCLTQPTVTYHIRSLEKSVGLKLLDVRRQKVTLTNAGAGLFRYVKEIYQQVTSAEKYLEDLREASFRVGIAATFSSSIASAAAEFDELYPHVKLIVRSASSLEIVEDVLSSQVDLGIVVRMDYENSKLRTITIAAGEKLVLVASPSSPIATKERIELADLSGYPLVAGPETSATRQIILNKFQAEGLEVPPSVIVEVNSLEWGLSLVESGKGVGLYHIKAVGKEIAEGRLKALPLANDITVGVDALLRSDAPVHPLAERFIHLVIEEFKAHG
ncbi:MAG TPA: LysR family transcriptional regulator [Dehalococcoidia bacterium]|nr:LysR family transcriptional regulator [Dehalococcoidia bacterium]